MSCGNIYHQQAIKPCLLCVVNYLDRIEKKIDAQDQLRLENEKLKEQLKLADDIGLGWRKRWKELKELYELKGQTE